MKDACELAAHAEAQGAAGIASMPPFFFKPQSAAPLVDFLKEVASAAPKTPFLYYHFPEITGVTVPNYDVLQAASSQIPTLSGV